MCRTTAIHAKSADQISRINLYFPSAGALAEPLQVLSALDAGHCGDCQFSEYLAGDIVHRGSLTAKASGEVFFLEELAAGVAVRALLVKAVADLCMQKTMRSDLHFVSAVTTAEPYDLSVKAFRCFLYGNMMSKSLSRNILNFAASIFFFAALEPLSVTESLSAALALS